MRLVSEDHLKRTVTYELPNGKWFTFDALAVRKYGIAALLKSAGEDVPQGRVDVLQHGKLIGTVPATFDPRAIRSSSYWYEPREGDFVREGDCWVASRTLGPGDLEAVPGFVRARPIEKERE